MTRLDAQYTVHNHAWGSTIGIQAAHVTGGHVSVHTRAADITSVADLAAAVTTLRNQLEANRTSGTVDRDTYEAAQIELATAETALRSSDTGEQRHSVLALKRLGGLISGATDLAMKVVNLIAAAGRLF